MADYDSHHENVKYHIHIPNFSQSNGCIYVIGHIHGREYLILSSRQQERRSRAAEDGSEEYQWSPDDDPCCKPSRGRIVHHSLNACG